MAIIIVILVGYFFEKLSLNRFLELFEKYVISNIPFIRTVYSGVQKVTKMISKKSEVSEAQMVAWVRLPYKNIYCLGLMTGQLPENIVPEPGKLFYCFFIPTTPNPVTGYYVVAAESDCVFTNISRQEAISMIMSGGIIKPDQAN